MNSEFGSALLRVFPFAICIFALRVAVKRNRISTLDLGLKAPQNINLFFTWWGFFLAFVVAIEVVLYKLNLLEVTPWHHTFLPSVIRITGMIVLAPVAEELLFRGMFLHKLTQWKLNLHVAVLIQAIVFVLLHSFTYQNTVGSNISIIQGLTDASLFAYARIQTRSIYTSIAMHATGNSIAVLEQFVL